MKFLVVGVALFSAVIFEAAFAESIASDLLSTKAKQIAADYQIPPVKRRQQLDQYLQRLSSVDLIALVHSVHAETILMHLAKEYRTNNQEMGVPQSEAFVLRSPEAQYVLRQHLSSYLLNTSK